MEPEADNPKVPVYGGVRGDYESSFRERIQP
jgi:hypothetical protein